MTKDEALKMCLEYIETNAQGSKFAILIKEALAQPEQEPVAWVDLELWTNDETWPDDCFSHLHVEGWTPLYTTPPQRKPLTDEEIRKANHHMVEGAYDYSFKQGVKWAEYKHGIKGEA